MDNPRRIAEVTRTGVMRHLQGWAHGALLAELRLFGMSLDTAALAQQITSELDGQLIPLPVGRELTVSARLTSQPWFADLKRDLWPLLSSINEILVRIQESAGLPTCSGMQWVAASHRHSAPVHHLMLLLPSASPTAIKPVLDWVVNSLDRLATGTSAETDKLSLESVVLRLSRHAPRGTNNRMLLTAAYQLGIPVLQLPQGVLQYGWGVRSRWMDSTFTDRTSNISARLARNKVAGHALMKRAGFPVPEQVTVATVEEAVQHARRIGYPIVVKPADLDGGRGVSAGLEDEPALRAAWARARAVSERTIVEKHIHGKDYRLGVFHGRLQWATYREPAGVTGDGVSTISQLIASANTDPRRGTRSWSSMRPLVVDAEAEEMLALQNIALADIPASGRHIRFRRASNISSGGIPASVLEAVHPDNARLAVEVARLFRLDFAGIDFITPDISQPWTEVGGGICEVNGQPQFSVASPWTAIKALECLLAGDGRIATAAVLGGHLPEATVAQVRMELAANGLDLLCCKDASKGGEVDSVLLDSTAGALLVHASAADWLAHGMPLDRVDLTVLLEPVDQQLIQSLGRVAMGKIIDATSMTNNHAHLAKELTDTLLKADRAHRLQT